jgi:hypothetical protein
MLPDPVIKLASQPFLALLLAAGFSLSHSNLPKTKASGSKLLTDYNQQLFIHG